MIDKVLNIPRHYLYRHIRLDKDEPFYIGIGSRKNRQGAQATYRASSTYTRNNIWNAITKKTMYDIEIVLESDDYEYIKKKEMEFIALYGRIDKGTGCLANMTDGGDGKCGWSPSQETKDKISSAQVGKKMSSESVQKSLEARTRIKNERGYWLTAEAVLRGAEKRKGRNVSDETRKKISEANKGRQVKESTKQIWSQQRKGRKLSKETLEKIVVANKGKKRSAQFLKEQSDKLSKSPIKGVDESTGNSYIFKNQLECAVFLNCNRITVMRTLLGRRSTNIINGLKLSYL